MLNNQITKINNHPYLVPIILLLVACINFLQAGFTELFHDEAYYWVWSRDIAWGYYDHPPMIAWLIRLGTSLFNHEFGVRFFTVILNVCTLFILYLLTDKKYPLIFFTLLLASPFVHIAGILSVPDLPFMFFVAAYLYCYHKFISENTWFSTLLLVLAVTGMLYSKYHGMMVLFFTILSYPKLLIQKKFWAIVLLSFTLYLPHFLWAYQHEFDTLKYHLFGRTRSGYKINFTLDYLTGEIAAAGGIIGIWIFYEAFLAKVTNQFTKSLKYIVVGIFGFLFIRTFSQHVEANWAASAFLPLFLLAYQGISEKPQHFHWIYKISLPTIIILFIARLFLVWNFLPISVYKMRNEFHGWQEWANQIKEIAKDCPVIFDNTYQYPSKYMFYANKNQTNKNIIANSLNSVHYRHNQYDIANYEEQMQGKRVMWIVAYPFEDTMKVLKTVTGKELYYKFVDNFHSFNKVKIKLLSDKRTFKVNEEVTFPIKLTNGYNYPCEFSACASYPTCIGISFWQKEVHKWEYSQYSEVYLANEVLKDTLKKEVTFKMPSIAGEYDMTLMLQMGKVYTGYNMPIVKIKVE